MVDAHGNLRFEGFERSVRIARPDPAAVARHAQMAVAMQRPGSDVRCFGEGPFVIELMALHALVEAKPVALVRPPRIDAGIDQRIVLFPIRIDVVLVHGLAGLGRNGSVQCFQTVPIPWDHVDDDFGMERVQVGEHVLGFALEHTAIEFEGWLIRIPTAWREAGAEVDDGVDWDLFFTKGVEDANHLRVIFQGPVRLHVTHRPTRRQYGRSRDRRNVFHELGRLVRIEDKHVVDVRFPSWWGQSDATLPLLPAGNHGARFNGDCRCKGSGFLGRQINVAPGRRNK